MSFLKTLGKVASAVGDAAKRHQEEVNDLVYEYENESESYLKRKLQGGSPAERIAAAKVLKSRGSV